MRFSTLPHRRVEAPQATRTGYSSRTAATNALRYNTYPSIKFARTAKKRQRHDSNAMKLVPFAAAIAGFPKGHAQQCCCGIASTASVAGKPLQRMLVHKAIAAGFAAPEIADEVVGVGGGFCGYHGVRTNRTVRQ